MTYAEIEAARAVAAAGRKGGVAFRHLGAREHVFVAQYPMAVDRPELFAGKAPEAWVLKRVGRAAGGHLMLAGFEPLTMTFTGWTAADECVNTALDAAGTEAKLLQEFLRGNVGEAGEWEHMPDPRIEVGYAVPWNVLSVDETPFDGTPAEPFGSDGYAPFGGGYTGEWLESVWVLVEGSYRYAGPTDFRAAMVEVTFQLRQVPRNAMVV